MKRRDLKKAINICKSMDDKKEVSRSARADKRRGISDIAEHTQRAAVVATRLNAKRGCFPIRTLHQNDQCGNLITI